MAQSAGDTYEKEGPAFMISYAVTDAAAVKVVIGKAGKAGAVKVVDKADDAADVAKVKKGGSKTNPNNVKVKIGQQDKHIPDTNNYKQSVANGINRSILKEDPQQLLDDFAGTGQKVGANKERVDFGKVIGQYYDTKTGTYVNTTRGMIHYDSKGGAHIVPSAPNGY